MRHHHNAWRVLPLFIALSSGVAGATCLAAGTLASSIPLVVIGVILLGATGSATALGLLLAWEKMRNKPQCSSNDDSARQTELTPRLSSRDLRVIRHAERVAPDRQRLLAVQVVVLTTAGATALLVVGALYSLDTVLALGLALLVVGPGIGFSRMVIVEQCEVISKLATMLRENGRELSDCEAQTESLPGQ